MNIYEINKEIMDCIDLETGEIIDFEKLQELKIERNTKIENVALWIKNLIAESEAIKEEMKSLSERKERKDKKVEQLKEFLSSVLENQKFETARVAISYRKSSSLNIIDEAKINKQYIKEVTTTSIDKMAIKEAIKLGQAVEGAEIVEKQNIQIK